MTVKRRGLLMALVASPIFSQTPNAIRRAFDVVSVKQNLGGDRIFINTRPGSRIVATNVPLRILLFEAFRPLQGPQVVGGPSWINSDRFDVEAKADTPITAEQMPGALQSLLEDRFKLRTHRDVRELPVYALTIAKGGPKLEATEPPTPAGGFVIGGGPGNYKALAQPIATLASFLAVQLGQPVVDRTGLKGYYDIELKFTPELLAGVPPLAARAAEGNSDTGTIFTALQEQLGLRLESGAKAPLDVVVIDSIQKPTEN